MEDALKTFKLPAGFHIECVASEPMVEDPISCAFDADGRIWVVEMRGYMHDLDGAGENERVGRIKILESTRRDGKYDKATIFLDGLVMPRAVLPTRGGALVAEPPELAFWTEKDGKAAEKTVVSTAYGVKGGQPEVMANGLFPALDNWIYNAAHTFRYRFAQGKWIADVSRSRGQWGVAQDNYGRLYYCSNTDLGRVDPFPSRYFMRNPYYQATAAQNVELMPFLEQDVWPSHPTPGTNRGYTDTELRADGSLTKPTAACGDSIYRGDLFSSDFRNNLFTPEPAGNLVKRMLIVEEHGQLAGRHAYQGTDFLTSTDERFRPVHACTGPDGALYIVDMYRGVIEHRAYLTNYLIKNIEERKLLMPIHRGRIYRVVPDGAIPQVSAIAERQPRAGRGFGPSERLGARHGPAPDRGKERRQGRAAARADGWRQSQSAWTPSCALDAGRNGTSGAGRHPEGDNRCRSKRAHCRDSSNRTAAGSRDAGHGNALAAEVARRP